MEIEPIDQAAPERLLFDEVPVGRKSNQNMFADQHPPGYVEAAPVQEQLPLEKRLMSKLWKFRQGALDELIQQCQLSDENVSRFEEQMAGWLADTNINCQERAFRLLDVYLSKRQKLNGFPVRDALKTLIEKGLVASKNDIVKHSSNCLVELLDKGFKTDVYAALIDGLTHKNPKVPVACVDASVLLLSNFGPKRLDMMKPLLKELQQHNETTSTLLRNALMNFYKEAYKWLGQGLTPFVKLKKPLCEQFDKFMKGYVRIPMVPLRATEQEALSIESSKMTEVDAYSMADPVDVLARYDDNWVDKTLDIVKWSDKKEVLDVAIAEMSTPKIVPRDHYHLVGMMKKLLADSNIMIQICGMKMAKALASGLRRGFNQGGKVLSPLLIGKLRDKKNQITDQAHKALKACLYSVSLEDMLESIKEGLADKAPNMRLQTLKFIQSSITKKDQKTVKSMLDIFLKLTTDGAVEVRDKVIEVITDVKKMFGKGFVAEKFKDVQSQKLQKILAESDPAQIEAQPISDSVSQPRAVSLQTKPQQPQQNRQIKTSTLQQPAPQPSRSLESIYREENSATYKQDSRSNNQLGQQQQQEPNIGSPTQSIKFQAYQSLITKPIPNVLQFLRSKSIRESQSNVLRSILTIYERNCQELTRADLEYLMLHDWRKCKNFLSDYLTAARIGQECNELIRQQPLLKEILGSRDSNRPKIPLVHELHSFLPKMMHLQFQPKLQAAQAMLHCLNQYKPIGEDFTVYAKEINEICNVMKCRINDPEPEISKKYIALARLLTKVGIVNKTRGRFLLPTIVARLGDPQVYLDVRDFMAESLILAPGNLFSYLHTMLSNQQIRVLLLIFIEDNMAQFIKSADMKAYIPALFHLLSIPGDTAVKSQRLLDVIVEVQGDEFLEKSIRELRIDAPQSYLAKWGIEKRPIAQPLDSSRTVLARLASKNERLRDQPLNPWPLLPSPSHIHQLVGILPQLPYPFSEMGTLLPVSSQLIHRLSQSTNLPEHSDIVVKWLFWRFQIERKEVVMELIGLAKRMVATIELEEIQLIILLAGLLGVVKLGPDVLRAIDELHQLFKPAQKQKVLRFWVNFIKDSHEGVNEILQVIMLCFRGPLSPELLVQLASHHSVRTNKPFIKYLLENYDRKSLLVYGFDLDESALKPRPSSRLSRRDENRPNNNPRMQEFVQSFRSKESAEILAEIARSVYPKPAEEKMQFYVQLWEALYNPVLQSDIKPANYIAFNVYISKELNALPVERVLGRLARLLLDMLMELDEKKPQGHTDIIKAVNNAMLKLLQVAPNRPMIDIMLTMAREELNKSREYSKLVGVICKCISKLVKSQQFSDVEWYINEVLRLFNEFYFNYEGQESPNHKVLRSTVADAINNSQECEKHREMLRHLLQKHQANEFLTRLFRDVAVSKPKEPTEDPLMLRLNAIKAKCGVDDMRMGPHIWEKKNAN